MPGNLYVVIFLCTENSNHLNPGIEFKPSMILAVSDLDKNSGHNLFLPPLEVSTLIIYIQKVRLLLSKSLTVRVLQCEIIKLMMQCIMQVK